jgi:predicted Zn finger-like uncharacterized protein
MALATKCPHCNTVFKVAADQLKLRGGIVRCGACKEVFDGNAALLHNAAPPTAAPIKAQPSAAPAPVAPVYAEEAANPAATAAAVPDPAQAWRAAAIQQKAKADEQVYALDFDLPSDPFETLAAPAPAPQHVEAGYDEEDDLGFDLDLDVDLEQELQAEFGQPPVPSYAEFGQPPVPSHAEFAQPPVEPAPIVVWQTTPAQPEPSLDLPESEAIPEAETEQEAAPAPQPELAPEPQFAAWSKPEPSALPDEEHELPAVTHELTSDRREPTFDIPDDESDDCIVTLSAPEPEPAHELADELTAGTSAETEEADVAEIEAVPSDAPAKIEPLLEAASDDDTHDHNGALAFTPPETSAPAIEEPGFVKQGRRRERIGKAMRILMGFGSALLLIALPIQAVNTFRNQLAAQLPQFKPTLEAACAVIGCVVELPAQIEMLTIEQGELQAIAENTFSYATVLHNQSTTVQAWPSIELILNDAKDKPVLRRVIAPADYLPAPAELKKGFAPRSELAIKLYFELTQLKASGYHIAVFYP